jgi:hypothetical protein
MQSSLVRLIAPKLTTTAQGALFEQRTHTVLHNQLSMALTRVGGKGDGGIDLQGDWWLPPPAATELSRDTPTIPTGWPEDPARKRLRVYVQCKAENKKLGPAYVREMEGVVLALERAAAATAQSDAANPRKPEEVVAVLSSEMSFTRGGLERARQSSVPFFLLHLPPTDISADQPDAIGGGIWNPALVKLLGPAFELRWERSATGSGAGRPGKWWNGRRLRRWNPTDATEPSET